MAIGKNVGKIYSSAELDTFAKEKLNEDPARRKNDIKAIKDWMSKQPHLKENCRNGKKQVYVIFK